MSEDHDAVPNTPDAALSRKGFADQLRQLEAFVTRAEAEGEALPPEAAEMVARLREIMEALDGLATSFDAARGEEAAGGTTPPKTETP